ncbi:MAG: hypothetical protein CXT72_04475 [Methanobacteriota archaeon]|jgi:hypothetical protein|nr:MAG: hypothetical protein CXT72_04475 [Euryarchaeota archaeon]HIG03911.1 hypothetical protein [Candidatus Poseidoniales archaeon]HIK96986.1 hypothetical protein [Gammaproteobacteria bacterium]
MPTPSASESPRFISAGPSATAFSKYRSALMLVTVFLLANFNGLAENQTSPFFEFEAWNSNNPQLRYPEMETLTFSSYLHWNDQIDVSALISFTHASSNRSRIFSIPIIHPSEYWMETDFVWMPLVDDPPGLWELNVEFTFAGGGSQTSYIGAIEVHPADATLVIGEDVVFDGFEANGTPSAHIPIYNSENEGHSSRLDILYNGTDIKQSFPLTLSPGRTVFEFTLPRIPAAAMDSVEVVVTLHPLYDSEDDIINIFDTRTVVVPLQSPTLAISVLDIFLHQSQLLAVGVFSDQTFGFNISFRNIGGLSGNASVEIVAMKLAGTMISLSSFSRYVYNSALPVEYSIEEIALNALAEGLYQLRYIVNGVEGYLGQLKITRDTPSGHLWANTSLIEESSFEGGSSVILQYNFTSTSNRTRDFIITTYLTRDDWRQEVVSDIVSVAAGESFNGNLTFLVPQCGGGGGYDLLLTSESEGMEAASLDMLSSSGEDRFLRVNQPLQEVSLVQVVPMKPLLSLEDGLQLFEVKTRNHMACSAVLPLEVILTDSSGNQHRFDRSLEVQADSSIQSHWFNITIPSFEIVPSSQISWSASLPYSISKVSFSGYFSLREATVAGSVSCTSFGDSTLYLLCSISNLGILQSRMRLQWEGYSASAAPSILVQPNDFDVVEQLIQMPAWDESHRLFLQAWVGDNWMTLNPLSEPYRAPYEPGINETGELTITHMVPLIPRFDEDLRIFSTLIVSAPLLGEEASLQLYLDGIPSILHSFTIDRVEGTLSSIDFQFPDDCNAHLIEIVIRRLSNQKTIASTGQIEMAGCTAPSLDDPDLFAAVNGSTDINSHVFEIIGGVNYLKIPITNSGVTPSGSFTVCVAVGEDDPALSEHTIDGLSPGESVNIYVPLENPFMQVFYRIHVDCHSDIREYYEWNNVVQNVVSVNHIMDEATSDSDGDSLSDLQESQGWTVYACFTRSCVDQSLAFTEAGGDLHDAVPGLPVQPSPDLADSDNDGLSDYQEFILETNPLVADSDGDGIWDAYDSNPLAPPLESPRIDILSWTEVNHFEFGEGSSARSWTPARPYQRIEIDITSADPNLLEVWVQSGTQSWNAVQTLSWEEGHRTRWMVDVPSYLFDSPSGVAEWPILNTVDRWGNKMEMVLNHSYNGMEGLLLSVHSIREKLPSVENAITHYIEESGFNIPWILTDVFGAVVLGIVAGIFWALFDEFVGCAIAGTILHILALAFTVAIGYILARRTIDGDWSFFLNLKDIIMDVGGAVLGAVVKGIFGIDRAEELNPYGWLLAPLFMATFVLAYSITTIAALFTGLGAICKAGSTIFKAGYLALADGIGRRIAKLQSGASLGSILIVPKSSSSRVSGAFPGSNINSKQLLFENVMFDNRIRINMIGGIENGNPPIEMRLSEVVDLLRRVHPMKAVDPEEVDRSIIAFLEANGFGKDKRFTRTQPQFTGDFMEAFYSDSLAKVSVSGSIGAIPIDFADQVVFDTLNEKIFIREMKSWHTTSPSYHQLDNPVDGQVKQANNQIQNLVALWPFINTNPTWKAYNSKFPEAAASFKELSQAKGDKSMLNMFLEGDIVYQRLHASKDFLNIKPTDELSPSISTLIGANRDAFHAVSVTDETPFVLRTVSIFPDVVGLERIDIEDIVIKPINQANKEFTEALEPPLFEAMSAIFPSEPPRGHKNSFLLIYVASILSFLALAEVVRKFRQASARASNSPTSTSFLHLGGHIDA